MNHFQAGRAYLLEGAAGPSADRLARAAAAGLLCGMEDRTGGCGRCSSCGALAEGTHPDFLEIRPPSAKEAISIEEVRELLRWIYQKPLLSAWRAGLILEAGRLSLPAQNALLKILEEPPAFSALCLVEESPARLLPTVRSRLTRIRASVPAEKPSEDARTLAERIASGSRPPLGLTRQRMREAIAALAAAEGLSAGPPAEKLWRAELWLSRNVSPVWVWTWLASR